jgi:hypothetical protein
MSHLPSATVIVCIHASRSVPRPRHEILIGYRKSRTMQKLVWASGEVDGIEQMIGAMRYSTNRPSARWRFAEEAEHPSGTATAFPYRGQSQSQDSPDDRRRLSPHRPIQLRHGQVTFASQPSRITVGTATSSIKRECDADRHGGDGSTWAYGIVSCVSQAIPKLIL